MRELAVGVREIALDVRTGAGERFGASLFLHDFGHHGPERMMERLESAEEFLPLRREDGVVLVNKSTIALLECRAVPDELAELEQMAVPRAHVRVRLRDGAEIEGEAFLLLPGTRHRVLDLLNAPGRYLLLSNGVGATVINKRWIDWVHPQTETN